MNHQEFFQPSGSGEQKMYKIYHENNNFSEDKNPLNVWHQKYENRKEGSQNYQEFLFNSILNISYRSGYRLQSPGSEILP